MLVVLADSGRPTGTGRLEGQANAGVVDLGAVKAAAAPELAACAAGAAANAQDLLDDAELLSAAARYARAHALAALAAEESGKAAALFVLALMPRRLRAQAPLGRLLPWRQLKLVGGMLIAAVPFGPRTIAAQLLALPPAQASEILENAQVLAGLGLPQATHRS